MIIFSTKKNFIKNISKMIPVILIHMGVSDYLQYSIKKALERNNVILIGDKDLCYLFVVWEY